MLNFDDARKLIGEAGHENFALGALVEVRNAIERAQSKLVPFLNGTEIKPLLPRQDAMIDAAIAKWISASNAAEAALSGGEAEPLREAFDQVSAAEQDLMDALVAPFDNAVTQIINLIPEPEVCSPLSWILIEVSDFISKATNTVKVLIEPAIAIRVALERRVIDGPHVSLDVQVIDVTTEMIESLAKYEHELNSEEGADKLSSGETGELAKGKILLSRAIERLSPLRKGGQAFYLQWHGTKQPDVAIGGRWIAKMRSDNDNGVDFFDLTFGRFYEIPPRDDMPDLKRLLFINTGIPAT